MGDTTTERDLTPPVIPWIQALGLLLAFGMGAIDAFVPDFDPPRELYFLFGAAIIGIGPEQVIRLALAVRGK